MKTAKANDSKNINNMNLQIDTDDGGVNEMFDKSDNKKKENPKLLTENGADEKPLPGHNRNQNRDNAFCSDTSKNTSSSNKADSNINKRPNLGDRLDETTNSSE